MTAGQWLQPSTGSYEGHRSAPSTHVWPRKTGSHWQQQRTPFGWRVNGPIGHDRIAELPVNGCQGVSFHAPSTLPRAASSLAYLA